MHEYSEELIHECIKHFKEEHNVELTREEANQALDGLGGLLLAFAKQNKE